VSLFPVRVLVPLSGGKDSQACLKLALETHSSAEVRGLFCDTQWEHPLTMRHLEMLRDLYGPVRIDRVSDGSVPDQILKHRGFPLGGNRFCTEELKIWPTKRYCKALAEEQGSRLTNKKRKISASDDGGFQVWYGMRSAESGERRARYQDKIDMELYPPHEVLKKYPQYLAKLGVRFRLPILDWSTEEVFDYLGGRPTKERPTQANPLYQWFDRVGCFPCQVSGDKNMEKAYAFDAIGAKRRVIIMRLADETGKSPWGTDAARARNSACALTCGD
jgi:3'-phosphoadenosine 5'-phosphosulfate sulfotransferase (PAPS reductase)/FAD synthetase